MSKKKASGNQVSGPHAQAEEWRVPDGRQALRAPLQGERAHAHWAKEPVSCQPQASHSASVTLSPLSRCFSWLLWLPLCRMRFW